MIETQLHRYDLPSEAEQIEDPEQVEADRLADRIAMQSIQVEPLDRQIGNDLVYGNEGVNKKAADLFIAMGKTPDDRRYSEVSRLDARQQELGELAFHGVAPGLEASLLPHSEAA